MAASLGCGDPSQDVSASDDVSVRGSDSQDVDSGVPSAESTDTGSLSLEGRWGLRITAASKEVGIPLIKTALLVNDSFYIVTARHAGAGAMTTTETSCATYMRNSTGLFKTIVPNAFVEHAAIIERHIELGDHGALWRSNNAYTIHGARLRHPETDPLPSSVAKDAAALPCSAVAYGEACDQDEDGYAGVTFIMTGLVGCRIHFASRINGGLDGAVLAPDHVAGSLWASGDEMSLLDASTSLCRSASLTTVSVLADCPELFTFEMVKLPDDADCQDVMALTTCDEGHPACVGDKGQPLNPPGAVAGDCLHVP